MELSPFKISETKYSGWYCCLFGSSEGNGIVWRPVLGKEPNWFWRTMQYLCFGNRWKKDK